MGRDFDKILVFEITDGFKLGLIGFSAGMEKHLSVDYAEVRQSPNPEYRTKIKVWEGSRAVTVEDMSGVFFLDEALSAVHDIPVYRWRDVSAN